MKYNSKHYGFVNFKYFLFSWQHFPTNTIRVIIILTYDIFKVIVLKYYIPLELFKLIFYTCVVCWMMGTVYNIVRIRQLI